MLLALLRQWVSRCKRHANQSFGLLTLNLQSDQASSLQDSVQKMLRAEDTVIALSPSHLAVVAGDLRHISDPLRIFLRLRGALGDQLGGVGIGLSASRPDSAEEMLNLTEQAAREAGPAGYRYADLPLQKAAEDRIELEQSLRQALSKGQIQPHYQPLIELTSGKITGFEALARWHHEVRGCLLPKEFLGIAADCGLLADLDVAILEQSLRQLEIWQRQVDRPIRLSVNLSPDHFLKPGGVYRLRPILDAHIPVLGQLRVDVSEQVLSQPDGLAALKELRNLKVGFHLDDFGVGPDSFHCLTSFPFHSLKIDRSLIAEMEEEVNAELIAALLRIARRMHMRTIAEGLVTHAQLEELRNLGCHEAQGFLFSPAVSAEQAVLLLKEEHCW